MARQAPSSRTGRLGHFRHNGEASVFTCPDCQGTLFLLHQENVVRLQCRVGHSYSPESMLESQSENVERLMWSAARALEEQGEYIGRMADELAEGDEPAIARDYFRKALSAIQKADVIRKLIITDSKAVRR